LALSVAPAAVPVLGRHLRPIGGFTAPGIWGARYLPDFVSAATRGWLTPGDAERR
jgi:hypothetical protein